MYTDMKLKTLMSIYRISNVTLARGVGADPSLVSRWRSGEREPSGEMLRDIAGFLSGLQMLPHDKTVLSQTVGAPCGEREGTFEALLRWLCGKAVSPPSEILAPASPESPPEPPPAPPETEAGPAESQSAGLAFHSGGPSALPLDKKWMGFLPLTLRFPRICPDARDALQTKIEMFSKPGLCLSQKISLSGFFLPADLILSHYPDTGARQLKELSDMRALFERHAASDGWVEYWPATLYDAVSINGSCAVSGFELFERHGLTLSGDALRATLRVVRACLDRYPGFRIVWSEGPVPQNTYIRGGDEALYVREAPFSAVHIRPEPGEDTDTPLLPPAPPGDRGGALLEEMIEALNY